MQANLLALCGITHGTHLDRIVRQGEVLQQEVSCGIGRRADRRMEQDHRSVGDMFARRGIHHIAEDMGIGRLFMSLCHGHREGHRERKHQK